MLRFLTAQDVRHAACIPASLVEACLMVAALPTQAWLVLLIEFLNSFRWYVLQSVQFQYITTEFHLTDKEAGTLIGTRATMQTIFGLLGLPLFLPYHETPAKNPPRVFPRLACERGSASVSC
eukprot:2246899-Amphidinium_carterae.1